MVFNWVLCGGSLWAVDMAGFLLDTLRGATMGTIFNSTIEAETSLFGLLFSQFLCVIFFISGGMEFILNILYESYQYLPPGVLYYLTSNF